MRSPEPPKPVDIDSDDDALLNALRDRDEQVFSQLVARWSSAMLRLALSHVENRAIAEYGASTLVCVPVSLAKNGPALGAQAGEQRLRDVFLTDGGFTRFRRATETPFNIVFEARP